MPGNFHREGGLYFDDNNTKYFRGPIPKGTILKRGDILIVMTDLSPRTLILGRVVELAVRFEVLYNEIRVFAARSRRQNSCNQRIGRIAFKKPEQWCKLWKNKSRLLKFWIHRQHAEEQYLEKLKLQKKGLMHDMLTGKVRVKMENLREAVS